MIDAKKEMFDIFMKNTKRGIDPSDVADKIIDEVIKNGKNSKNDVMKILMMHVTECIDDRESMYSELKSLAERIRRG